MSSIKKYLCFVLCINIFTRRRIIFVKWQGDCDSTNRKNDDCLHLIQYVPKTH